MKTLSRLLRFSLLLIAIAFLALIVTGCAGVSKINGQIVSQDTTCLGIDLSQSQTDPVPHLRLGLVRTTYTIIPIQRNTNSAGAVVISSPNYKTGVRVQHKLWSLDANEQLAAGETNVVMSADFNQNTNVFNTGTAAVK